MLDEDREEKQPHELRPTFGTSCSWMIHCSWKRDRTLSRLLERSVGFAAPLSLCFIVASADLQILGIILTLLCWVNVLVSLTLPPWKVTAFIGNNIMVVQVV